MGNRNSVNELIDDGIAINPEAYKALRAFKRSKPWRGTFAEREGKFQTAMTALAAAYGLTAKLEFRGIEYTDRQLPGNGAYCKDIDTIILVGRLSVVTFLHCLVRARGRTAREAFSWSLSVFKRVFPISFARCRHVGPFLVRD